jgi:hypothetical protein
MERSPGRPVAQGLYDPSHEHDSQAPEGVSKQEVELAGEGQRDQLVPVQDERPPSTALHQRRGDGHHVLPSHQEGVRLAEPDRGHGQPMPLEALEDRGPESRVPLLERDPPGRRRVIGRLTHPFGDQRSLPGPRGTAHQHQRPAVRG